MVGSDPGAAEAQYQLGNQCLGQGNLAAAAEHYQQAIRLDPQLAKAHSNLGNVFYAQGRWDDAAFCYQQALRILPTLAETHSNLASLLLLQGHIDLALVSARQAIQCKPELVAAHLALGSGLQAQGQWAEAELSFRQALTLNPNLAKAHHHLGSLYQAQGKRSQALACFQTAISIQPNLAEAHNNLGLLLYDQGDLAAAQAAFEQALQIDSEFGQAYNNLGNVRQAQGDLAGALELFQTALTFQPGSVITLCNLGNAYFQASQVDLAVAVFEQAVALAPDDLSARLGLCTAQLPIIYENADQILTARIRYQQQLQALSDRLQLETPSQREQAAAIVGSQPFYLAYQGFDDRDLRQQYGSIIHRMMTARYPEWNQPLALPPRQPDGRIRVGIVSGYFSNHAVYKILTRGWVEQLDPSRVCLFGYRTSAQIDSVTESVRPYFERFDEEWVAFEPLCERIRSDDLHVLLYPEIGMDPVSAKLASLRLAPVQCLSWGHPETSGLSTLDYFLTSDAMEPPDGDLHYTEKLIRLPHLGTYYSPLGIEPTPTDFGQWGVQVGSVTYLCAQSLYKYLPQYDEIFPQIAQAVGSCQFLFLRGQLAEGWVNRFRQRLERAFKGYSLVAENYVRILPRLNTGEYAAYNLLGDVFLDSIGWSGGNTTFETLAFQVPVVTLPGSVMRACHSAAILRQMGMTETIATNLDNYVQIASRLGTDPTWREQLSSQIATQIHRVYRDQTALNGLLDFLQAQVP